MKFKLPNKIIYMLKLFAAQSFLTLTAFILLLYISRLPGGAVGMAPLVVMIIISIQFISGAIIYIFSGPKVLTNKLVIKWLIIYALIYELTYFFMSGNFAVINYIQEEDSIVGLVILFYSISSILGFFLTIAFIQIYYVAMNKILNSQS